MVPAKQAGSPPAELVWRGGLTAGLAHLEVHSCYNNEHVSR